MEKINKERYLIKILKELALEHKLTIRFFCFDWLIELSNPHHKFHILGYDWAINSATAQAIAKDKSACFEILKANQVPSIEHFLFLSPEFQSFIGANGNWKKIIDFAQKHDNKIVIKSNMGTGGNEVFLVSNQAELEGCVQALFSKHRAIAICPFYDIHNEYRVILLDEEPLLCYNKIKPFIVGNGENTLLELILQHKGEFDLKDIFTQKIDFNIVLLRGKKFELNWKHNLGKGASPEIIAKGEKFDALIELAIKASKAIGIRFASIDIAETEGGLSVMEINSGIMTENFAQQGDAEYEIAKNMYRKAIFKTLDSLQGL